MAKKKVIAVIGATGNQGGGLCNAILNDPADSYAGPFDRWPTGSGRPVWSTRYFGPAPPSCSRRSRWRTPSHCAADGFAPDQTLFAPA